MEYKTLKEIATNFRYGKMPDKSKITDSGDYPVWSGYRYVGYYNEKNVNKDEIVVVARGVGGTGDVKICKEDCFLTNLSIAFNVNEDVNPLYVYYYYQIKNLRYLDSGSAQSQITINDLKNVKILVPSKAVQDKIVEVLNKIDRKIELNNKINNNLHKYCIDLFKETFNKFEYEDTLDNICVEITRGFTKGYVEKSNLINLNQKVNKGEVLEKQYYKYLDENQVIPENRYVKENDILLNSLGQGTLGRVHLFGENTSNIVVDQHITILRTGNQINPYYLYYLLISPEYQNKIESSVTGTTGMLMLNISAVRNMKIPVPSQKDLNSFKVIVAPIRKKITNSNLENEILIQLRDTLLPKLMNGEINLDNVEI